MAYVVKPPSKSPTLLESHIAVEVPQRQIKSEGAPFNVGTVILEPKGTNTPNYG